MTDLGHGQKEKFAKTFGSGNIADTTSKFRLNVDSGTDTLDQSFLVFDAGAVGTPQWQSLTAGLSGSLTKVSIRNESGVAATNVVVSIYSGTGVGGTLLAQETGITAPHNTVTDVTITAKPEVINTGVYTIDVSGTNWNWAINTAGGYPGGSYKGSSSDAVFRFYVDTGYNLEYTSAGSLLYDAPLLNLSGIPLVLANVSSKVPNVTGDGTLYGIIFDNETVDHDGMYNHATGIATALVTGYYEIEINEWLRDVAATHTSGIAYVTTTSNSYRVYQGNPANERDPTSGDFSINRKVVTKLTATDTVQCHLVITGNPKTVDIGIIGTTQLSIKLISIS